MRTKICEVGHSHGIILPAVALKRLKLEVGSEVEVLLDETKGWIIIEPVQRVQLAQRAHDELDSEVDDFIKKYRPALKRLAEE